jgi:uncharacterized protein YjbI with pentapeptide repeats
MSAASSLSRILNRVVGQAAKNSSVSFRNLVEIAGLSPEHDFIGATLRGVDFRDEDLRGFDFSKADLTGADFRRADIRGARFDDAVLVGAIGLGDVRYQKDDQEELNRPPPDFDILKVKELLLQGNSIPEHWVPYVFDLDFSFEASFDLEPLAPLRNLKSLDLTKVPIEDLGPLKTLFELRELRLGDTNVADLGVLANLRKLATLDLTNTKVTDINALANAHNLKNLFLMHTSITNLRPLSHIQGLRIIGNSFQFGASTGVVFENSSSEASRRRLA